MAKVKRTRAGRWKVVHSTNGLTLARGFKTRAAAERRARAIRRRNRRSRR